MGLTLDEFWGKPDDIYTGVTLREFEYYVEAYSNRMESVQSLAAWHAANIMNVWTKRTISPDKLLGKSESLDLDAAMGGKGGSGAESLKETLRKQSLEAQKNSGRTVDVVDSNVDFMEVASENQDWLEDFVESLGDE